MIDIDETTIYENGKIKCELSITKEAIEKAEKQIEDEVFAAIARRKGYVKERTCEIVGAYCSKCGRPDPSSGDALYCAYCGSKIVQRW